MQPIASANISPRIDGKEFPAGKYAWNRGCCQWVIYKYFSLFIENLHVVRFSFHSQNLKILSSLVDIIKVTENEKWFPFSLTPGMIFDSTSLMMSSQGSGSRGASDGRRGLKYPGPTSGVTLRLWILLMNSQMYSTISLPRMRNSWMSMMICSVGPWIPSDRTWFRLPSQLSRICFYYFLVNSVMVSVTSSIRTNPFPLCICH